MPCRARRTAELVLKRMDDPPPVEEEDRLRERAFGDWEGMTWSDIQKQFPDDVQRSRHDADYKISGGGESRKECLSRALDFLSELPKVHAPGDRCDPATMGRRASTCAALPCPSLSLTRSALANLSCLPACSS